MSDKENEVFMRRAIELSRRASIVEKTGGVFGAVIVKDGKIISEGYNQVIKNNDPTWHAEMHAIREACNYCYFPWFCQFRNYLSKRRLRVRMGAHPTI
jgi:tRNA(Arg) A34 adenosine deaminase TadA